MRNLITLEPMTQALEQMLMQVHNVDINLMI